MAEIRKATQKDIPAIVSLIRELAQAGGETSPISEDYAARFCLRRTRAG
jgi:N-acetylglutamate synthase-like GNAT family acetyltransferase